MKAGYSIFFTAICMFFFTPVLPNETLTDTVRIEEVSITATKTLRNIREVPARIAIISSSVLQSTPMQQVDDVLRFIPGLNVYRSSGLYTQRPMITLRGLSGNEQSRTLVLLNGVPINTSDEGGVNWNRINTFDVKHIEVFKGPGSSLYGNNAMGGVINIITQKPIRPQEIFGAVSYGTYNTLRQDLIIRARTEKGYYGSISQYYLKSDGYISTVEEKRTPYDIPYSLEETGLSARAGNDQADWLNWELQYDIFRDERGEGYMVYAPKGCYRNFNTNLFRGNMKGGNEQTNYDMNIYYQLEHYYDINERLRGDSYSRYDVSAFRRDLGALLNASHEIIQANTLTAGMEFKQGSIHGGDYYQTPRRVNDTVQVYDTIYNAGVIRTLAGYIQDEHAFFNRKLIVVAGLRYDRVMFSQGEYMSTDPWNTIPELNDHTWPAWSPRIGLRLNFIPELSSYISYSHGFRASILDDLTRTGWMWVGPKYANPNLGPESVDNYEVGIDIIPLHNMKISASAYYAKGDDFLYYVATDDSLFGRPIYIRKNVTAVALKGFEADFKYEITKGMLLTGNYTYTDSRIDAFTERPELVGKQLTYTSQHAASSSLFWQSKYINCAVRGLYKGQQFSDDLNDNILNSYFTFDIRVSSGNVLENYIISLDIQDVFDNKHMISSETISPGRVITTRLAITF